MSQASVDAARRWIDAYNRRDFDGLLELTDRDIEFRSTFVQIEPVFRGHEGIHAYSTTSARLMTLGNWFQASSSMQGQR
jgi:SnoaL-like domain